MIFSKISDVDLSVPASWQDKIFLTFDIDWAHDDVLDYSIRLVEKADVCATWFVTHETKLLDRLRENPKFELAIHPNFNFLLNGDLSKGGNVRHIIEKMMDIVPDASSVRSHSMTQSTNILDAFAACGLKYECNHFIPHQAGIALSPWKTWNGLVKVPYFWEDDINCIYGDNTPISSLLSFDGIKVFDFHPIHVFLNTENLKRYESCREFHCKPYDLRSFINTDCSVGSQAWLIKIISGAG